MAGAGVKKGFSYGETDEFGYNIVEAPVHVHDFQATLLHLLGLDHEKLIYKHQGRRFRLTDVHGEVVKDILSWYQRRLSHITVELATIRKGIYKFLKTYKVQGLSSRAVLILKAIFDIFIDNQWEKSKFLC